MGIFDKTFWQMAGGFLLVVVVGLASILVINGTGSSGDQAKIPENEGAAVDCAQDDSDC